MRTPGSDDVTGYHKSQDNDGQEAEHDIFEAFFDEISDGVSEISKQTRHNPESHASRDGRQNDEQEKVVARETRGDGHQLVGDGGRALDEDDPGSVFGIQGAEFLKILTIAIDGNEPLADGVVKQRSDGIT